VAEDRRSQTRPVSSLRSSLTRQLPRSVQGGQPYVCRTAVRCHGGKGRHIYSGQASRTIVFEGYEEVKIGDVPYTDCVRLRIETQLDLPWVASVGTTEYVWLAPRIGEVQRVRRWKGFMLLTYFEGVARYELMRMALPPPEGAGAVTDGETLQGVAAVRGVPAPRVALAAAGGIARRPRPDEAALPPDQAGSPSTE